jgi:glutaredoxin
VAHPLPDITVFGKKGCKLCDAAKDKLDKLGLPFRFIDLERISDGEPCAWRTEGATDAMAMYQHIATLPVISIDGACLTYPQAVKRLKGTT